jgi:Tfp pilus assembly protein PilV
MSRRIRVGPRRRTSRRARRGASLIEILIACTMMTVGVLGLLGTTRKVAEAMGSSRSQLIAASVAQSRLDSLQSLSCAALSAIATGTRTTRGIGESWTITSGTNTRLISLTLTIPRMSKSMTYRTIVPCI